MKEIFKTGDRKKHSFIVRNTDLAEFASQQVHPVCSTFTLAREMEWASRLFVLDMIEEDEEGIGTSLVIRHLSPALEGEKVEIVAELKTIHSNEIHCNIEVFVNNRAIATGETGQKILKRTKIASLLQELGNGR